MTHIYQWPRLSLVNIMACRLVGTKPLSKPMMEYCDGPLATNYNEILIVIHECIFIHKNTFENVRQMAAILSWPQCVKSTAWMTNCIHIKLWKVIVCLWKYHLYIEMGALDPPQGFTKNEQKYVYKLTSLWSSDCDTISVCLPRRRILTTYVTMSHSCKIQHRDWF